jgi:hypothetical protein
LLGDSFTAGKGGCSWVGKLRALVPDRSIYNAGLPGSGVENWAGTEDHLAREGRSFDHVLVIFISDDFFRKLGHVREHQLTCLHDAATCLRTEDYPVDQGLDLFAVTAARARPLGLRRQLVHFWQRYLWVSNFLAQQVQNLLVGEPPKITPATIAAFDRIMASSKSVHLLQVTQKEEAALRADNAASIVVDRYLDSRGIPYDRCSLSPAEFLRYDGHPNAAGYAHLARCVAEIVRRLPAPAT